jgi:hypothetical protein
MQSTTAGSRSAPACSRCCVKFFFLITCRAAASATPAVGCVGERAVGMRVRPRGRALVAQHAGRLLVVAQAPVPKLPPADLKRQNLIRSSSGRSGCLLLGGAGCESRRQQEQVQCAAPLPWAAGSPARPGACHRHALWQQGEVPEHGGPCASTARSLPHMHASIIYMNRRRQPCVRCSH